MVTPLLRSGNSHLWLHFSATDWSGTGIEKWYGDYTYDDAYNKIPLLTQAAISDEYYTAFDGYTYSEETACLRFKIWRSTGKKIRWNFPESGGKAD